jgi:hypothetical protein
MLRADALSPVGQKLIEFLDQGGADLSRFFLGRHSTHVWLSATSWRAKEWQVRYVLQWMSFSEGKKTAAGGGRSFIWEGRRLEQGTASVL